MCSVGNGPGDVTARLCSGSSRAKRENRCVDDSSSRRARRRAVVVGRVRALTAPAFPNASARSAARWHTYGPPAIPVLGGIIGGALIHQQPDGQEANATAIFVVIVVSIVGGAALSAWLSDRRPGHFVIGFVWRSFVYWFCLALPGVGIGLLLR